MNYISNKYSQSVKVSISAASLVITEVDEKLILKFKTTAEKKIYLDSLQFWEQELYEQTKDDYTKFSRIIRKDLLSAYSILYSICYVSLHNRLKAEPDYQAMIVSHRYDMIVLYQLIRKIYNGLTSIVVDNMLGNIIESLYSFMLEHGDDYSLLTKYMKASE